MKNKNYKSDQLPGPVPEAIGRTRGLLPGSIMNQYQFEFYISCIFATQMEG
jgi:hypothetical protein